MPQAIPLIFSAAGTAGVIGATTAAWLTIGSSIAVGLYERDRAKSAKRRAIDAYNRSIQDRIVTVRSAVSARTYVLGTVRTGGTLLHAETVGQDKTALDMVVALAANETSLLAYYINDEYLEIDEFPGPKYGSDVTGDFAQTYVPVTGPSATLVISPSFHQSVTGNPIPSSIRAFEAFLGGTTNPLTITSISPDGKTVNVTGITPGAGRTVIIRYRMLMGSGGAATEVPIGQGRWLEVQFKNGTADQEATTWGDSYPSSLWTENHRLRGVSYLRTLMIWNENVFNEGIPDLSAVLRGRQIDGHPFYDPRTGTNPTTTDNPAILAAWWMTLSRARGGCGIPSDWIDWDWVAAAANVCDELITVRTLDGTGYEQVKRYTCNTVLSTEDDPISNLEIILNSMNGRRAFTASKYRIVAGAFRAATLTLTDAHVIGSKPMSVLTSGNATTPPNVVTAKFADAARNWAETSPKAVRNQDYVVDDGREEPLDIQLPATTDARLANYLQGVTLESNRPAFAVEVTVNGIGEDIAIFDCVQLDIDGREVYDGRTFEVLAVLDNWDGTFTLTLAEIRTQTWELDPDTFTPIDPIPVVDNSYLWNVPALTGFTADIGEPQMLPDGNSLTRVNLSWDAPPVDYVATGGHIEIRYSEAGGQWIGAGSIPADQTGTSITAHLIDGGHYIFQARVVNAIGAVSNWASSDWIEIDGEELAVGELGPGLFTWTNPVGVNTGATTITKTGSAGWNAGAHSLQSYSNGCFMSARAGQANTLKAIGLNSDPAVDVNYTGIDFVWYMTAAGALQIYESGTLIGSQGSYTTDTLVAVKYDGEAVYYEKDGVSVRTVTGQSGRRFFLDVSLNTAGASFVDVLFGPMGGRGTPGLTGANAQTIRVNANHQAFVANSSNVITSPTSITLTANRQNIASAATWTAVNQAGTPVTLTGSGDSRTLTSANFGSSTSVTITAAAGGFSDSVTIVRLVQGANGANAFQPILTNQSHTLAADPDGVVGSYSGASGLFFLYEGTTDRTSDATFSIVSQENCTAEINTAANTPVSGQPKGFYRVTAVTADQARAVLRATYNGINYDLPFNVTRARAGAPGDGTNLLRVDQWQVGEDGQQGSFTPVGSTGVQNVIVLGGAGTAPLGPFGITEPLWQVNALGADAANEPEGGWTHPVTVDHRKTYRASVWVRVNALDGRMYFGARNSAVNPTLNLDGSGNTNPYYISGISWGSAGLEANKWYLLVGLLHGSGYAGGYSGFAGIYDPVTAKRVLDGTEFKLNTVGTAQVHRAYYYDADSASSRQWFARPRFEEINGNEPSIDELMGFVPTTPWKARGNCVASSTTMHKPDGSNGWDSDVYSIQGYRNCHLQFKPGQTNRALMVGLNSDPASSQNYQSIDRAWYCVSGGALQIYEGGTLAAGGGGELGTYTTSTELAITYDGTTTRYYKDRVIMRNAGGANQLYYFDSSFNAVGGSINFVRWGPGTAFESVSTGDIDPGAATGIYTTLVSSADPTPIASTFAEVTVPAQPVAHTAIVTVVADVWKTNGADTASCYIARLSGPGGTPQGTVGGRSYITSTESPGQRAAVQFQYNASANTAYTYAFRYLANTIGNSGHAREVSLQVEVIKL